MAAASTSTHTEERDANTNEDKKEREEAPSRFGLGYLMKYLSIFNTAPEEEFHAEWLTIDEYIRQAEESMQQSWRIINLPNWRQEKKGATKGDIVESKHTDQFGKVYRFTGIVNCPPEFLFQEFKTNITRLPEWNPTILKSEVIKEIADGIDLSYQITAGGGKGIIAPRDFVILRRAAPLTREGRVTSEEPYCYISSGVSVTVPGYPPNRDMVREGRVTSEEPYCYISSGVSVTVPGYPPNRDMVRGHNKVGCWVLKPKTYHTPGGKIEQQTVFQWLMCCDLKGKIPQFVLDAAFATVMLDYIVHVRKFAADAKAKGLF